MRDRNGEPVRTVRDTPQTPVELPRKPVVSNKRQVAGRKESRPWAVRRIDGPSWVEKVEHF